ncbi:HD domain-containing protein [Alkanindiges hydrocarboniclasticus]|nr:HD domain-containing protein [Alkanindiges hydrocarboniclasticus]
MHNNNETTTMPHGAPLGSYLWTQRSHGRLSMKEKQALIRRALLPSMTQFFRTMLHLDQPKIDLTLKGIALPDSRFVREAIRELEACATPALIGHSWRTYYWGAALGQIKQFAFDPESLLIGCLFHDLGFTDAHGQSPAGQRCGCFTLASAEAAKTWSRKVNYPADKADAVADMICLHMNAHLDEQESVESRLLQQGAACDVIGARFYQLNSEYRQGVLRKYPRQGFDQQFSQLIAQEAARNPHSRTALLKQLGLPLMIRLNPFKD